MTTNFELLKEKILEKESSISQDITRLNSNRTQTVIQRVVDNSVVSTTSDTFLGGLGSIIEIPDLTIGKAYEITSIVSLSFNPGAGDLYWGYQLLDAEDQQNPIVLKSHCVICRAIEDVVSTVTDVFRLIPTNTSLFFQIDLKNRLNNQTMQKDKWEVIVRTI